LLILSKIERYKDKRRYDIYIDGEQVLRIHEEVLIMFGLRTGDRLNDEIIENIRTSEEFVLAKEKAIAILSRRMRSEKELRDKLRIKEFHPEIIGKVIIYLRECGFIDDTKFAMTYTNHILSRKPAGKALLQRELRLKGISQTITNDTITKRLSDGDEDELARTAAQQFLKKHQRVNTSIDEKIQRQKLTGFLARRGFSWQTIYRVLRSLNSDIEEQIE